MHLIDRVERTIRRHDLAGPGTRVVAAVSGGSDSVALAFILQELTARGAVRLAGLAHFNHQLRATADRDEQFCRDQAAALQMPLLSDREDVAARAARDGVSIEEAARAARYGFFERALGHFDATAVALGHTRDDQAETFLLRLLRGAGPRGLAAMHPRRDHIVRPLIECRRADLRAYLAERGVSYMDDETNSDVSIPRNRVRAELLPFIEARFNPAIVDVLADEAEIAREDWQWITAAAADGYARSVRREAEAVCLDARLLADMPPAVARAVVLRAMTELSPRGGIAFAHVQAVLDCIHGGVSALDLPRQRAERIGTSVFLTSRPHRTLPHAAAFRYTLPIPGEVELGEAGVAVSAERAASSDEATRAVAGSGVTAVVQSATCQGPLTVRSRHPGDAFHPPGLRGRKKLQDYFVDRKVPRRQRDMVPLVVDATDRIVWVAGYAIDHEFRITDPAQAVIILRLRQVR